MASLDSATQLSQSTFLGITWLLFSLCTAALAARVYIRWTCFGHLLAEDWLMGATLCLVVGIQGLAQGFAHGIYGLMAWVNDPATVKGNLFEFLVDTEAMLKACGSSIILFIVGFYCIKVNFLIFFYRLGNRVARVFWIVWWVVLVVVIACGIASVTMGVPTFQCLFGDIAYTLTTCQTHGYEDKFFTYFRVSVALDIFTDALIIGFPVWILWGVRISLRKKIALGAIFSLVGFTIVATILRGALLSEVFTATSSGKTFNIPWVWFWFHIEFCTAFIVACLVSFRSLFVHRDKVADAARERAAALQRRPSNYKGRSPDGSGRTPQNSGNGPGATGGRLGRGKLPVGRIRGRIRLFQDSILDTCRTLEGVLDDGTTLAAGPSQSQPGRSRLGAVPEGDTEAQLKHHGHDPARDEYERDSDEEGEVVAIAAPAPAVLVTQGSLPQRWGTVSTARLSLDSLYLRESLSRSPTAGDSPQGWQRRSSITVSCSSPITVNPVYQGWRRDSLDEAEKGQP